MDLHPVVNAYFEADKNCDAKALVEVFAADAVVKDEGGLHEGVKAIGAWWSAAKEKYRYVAEPIEVAGTGRKFSVRANVSGQFPNSPVMLDFLFTLDEGRIVELEIH